MPWRQKLIISYFIFSRHSVLCVPWRQRCIFTALILSWVQCARIRYSFYRYLALTYKSLLFLKMNICAWFDHSHWKLKFADIHYWHLSQILLPYCQDKQTFAKLQWWHVWQDKHSQSIWILQRSKIINESNQETLSSNIWTFAV